MRRFDFVAAYLQGELLEGEVVYCCAPSGYHFAPDGKLHPGTAPNGMAPHVCRVVKPIYGMAQAGRRWQRTLFPWLLEQGFTQLHSDPCVFRKRVTRETPTGPREEELIVGCYVDDLAIIYEYDDAHSCYAEFTHSLQSAWDVEDEGELSDLLGIEFVFGDDSVELRQTAYIRKMVDTYFPDGMPEQLQPSCTPADKDLPQVIADALTMKLAGETPDPALLKRYQSLVGALLYAATNTRPDIAYATGMLCRCMSCPTEATMTAAERVLRYLDRHRDIGLRYTPDQGDLHGMSDSDWAVKHSTSGWVFQYNSAAISWGSRKQVTVALSSCEAEIMAASETAKEAIYLKRFLEELDQGSADPLQVGVDNQSAIACAYNPEHHARVKHIERRHFFVREAVENMQITVPFVSTVDNLADFFTKPQPARVFFAMRDIIMNVPKRT